MMKILQSKKALKPPTIPKIKNKFGGQIPKRKNKKIKPNLTVQEHSEKEN
jgi:hypothetical protein